MTGGDAERSLEIERKYDVDDDTAIPDWRGLPGVISVGVPERRSLDARYLDTDDGRLGRSAVALRRRTGGPDEGWHIKHATPEGKHEARWPLDDAAADAEIVVPDAVAASLVGEHGFDGLSELSMVARIRNERTAYALRDERGDLVAEFVDDRVSATDARRGTETHWREWELELGPAAPTDDEGRHALFSAADVLVSAVGGSVSASGSKLGRALGV
ncbi:MAG: CYTH domain-containing protein [Candidatus Microbacterium phytovorans]|uniref:CYTH domain-containing protein n=1 Tax=Candidatus Microbacterium phytovorans TaxID=3121374 RepID=A0AAJ5W105_9MICO|nr:CYTH domain-containing protein [Microbacterium sp.]WEK14126.1 MAG: CYTH domain-containing protein [Microbacterium sp.]